MWILLVASTLFFAYFGVQLRYEENIIKLLPRSSTSSELAFGDIEIKDKIFVQATSRDSLNPVAPSVLGRSVEEFCRLVEEKDSSTQYLSGILSTLEADMGLGAMDFALNHLPAFVDPAWYPAIEASLSREAIDKQMIENYGLVMEDETGEVSQLVSMDPLNLREVLVGNLFGEKGGIGGFTIEDGHLFCPDKTVALAFLSPSFDALDSGRATRLVRMMERAQREYEAAHPDIRILMHGNPLGSVSNAGTIKRDLVWTLGLSLLLILLIMLMSFHRIAFVWQQVVPFLWGALFAMACMYWIKGYMSFMALGICAIDLGVAISYCLHVLIHHYYVDDVTDAPGGIHPGHPRVHHDGGRLPGPAVHGK